MANLFPCPNPACTYQFDADQLPAAAMVTCPLCRTRFPYRKAAPAPADEADNPWGGGAPADDEPRPTRPNRLVTPRHVPKANKSQAMLVVVGFSVVVATVLAVVLFTMRKNPFASKDETPETFTDETFNFKFHTFDKRWEEDKALRGRLNANVFMYKRADDSAWIGLRAKDFGKKNPRPGEMRGELLDMLNSNFKGLTKTRSQTTIAGAPADVVQFSGQLGGTPVTGEGYAFYHQGIGYVLIAWAPDATFEQAWKDVEAQRKSFEFAGLRDKWAEEGSSVASYFVKGGDYELSDVDGVWERAVELNPDEDPLDPSPKKVTPKRGAYVIDNVKDKDPKATMAFEGKHRVKAQLRRDLNPRAEAVVLVLDKAEGDPLEAARTYWGEKVKKEEGSEGVTITFEPLDKSPTGVEIPKSDAKVGIFQSTHSTDRGAKKFYVIAALPIKEKDKETGKEKEKLVAAVAWCSDRDADYMEPYMVNFISSLHERR